jgi:hypothetical protein
MGAAGIWTLVALLHALFFVFGWILLFAVLVGIERILIPIGLQAAPEAGMEEAVKVGVLSFLIVMLVAGYILWNGVVAYFLGKHAWTAITMDEGVASDYAFLGSIALGIAYVGPMVLALNFNEAPPIFAWGFIVNGVLLLLAPALHAIGTAIHGWGASYNPDANVLFETYCPKCAETVKVFDRKMVGKPWKCRGCGHSFTLTP